MENHKYLAARRFLEENSVEIELGRELLNNPGIVKDAGLKRTLLDSSVTLYRALMYSLGTPPMSIRDNVYSITKERSTRNGIVEFAGSVYSTWDLLNNNSQELKANQEVIVSNS